MSNRSFRRAHARRVEREGRRARALARRGRLLAGSTLMATALMTASAQAADYVVTTNTDDPNGTTCQPSPTGTCTTLRDAINSANQDSSTDTITFEPTVTGAITLSNGALYLKNANGIDIEGPGAGTLAISGGNSSQIFTFSNAAPASPTAVDKIDGLTLTNGRSNGSNDGGAIDDVHTTSSSSFQLPLPVSLTGDVVRDSQSGKYGGGIATSAPLALHHTTVTGNLAERGGGIAAFPTEESFGKYGNLVTVDDGSVISYNRATSTGSNSGAAPNAGGGGILTIGDVLDVRQARVSGNRSATTGGGIAVASKYGAAITHSTVSGNTAMAGGGVEFYGFNLTNSGHQYRQDKYSPSTVDASIIKGNHARDGAGVQVYTLNPGNPLTIMASTISGNSGGPGSFGGGIGVTGNLRAPFQLIDSTIARNTAASGGGVSLGDGFKQPLTAVNAATGKPGSVSLENSTIAANTAMTQGGGIYLGEYTPSGGSSPRSGEARLNSTIVAGNYAAKAPNDLARATGSTAGGFNANFTLIQTPGSAPVTHQEPNIIGKNPDLGPLANNGGPTMTMLPQGKSPVIDQGHNSLGLTLDQRGLPRKVDTSVPNPTGGDGTDIGAVELQAGQVKASTRRFTARVGSQTLSGHSTPLLVGGRTPVSCQVNVGKLASCVVEVRLDGYLLAAGGTGAGQPSSRLSTTVKATRAAQRYLTKHDPHGVDAEAYVMSAGDQLVAVIGRVHLVAAS